MPDYEMKKTIYWRIECEYNRVLKYYFKLFVNGITAPVPGTT